MPNKRRSNNARKPKAKPKPNTTTRARKPRAPRVPRGVSARLVEQVCAVTDPFCPAARGAKWPDKSSSNTVTFQSRVMLFVNTGAAGHGSVQFFPGSSTKFYLNTADAGTTHTIVANTGEDAAWTAAIANFAEVRVVSAGATWWDASPTTASGGSVIVSEFPSYDACAGSALSLTTIGQGTNSDVYDRRTPGSFISRPSDDNAYHFTDPDTAGVGAPNNRTGILLSFSGTASTYIAQVELIVNYECTLLALSAMARLASRDNVDASPQLKAVSEITDAKLPSFINVAGSYVSRTIKPIVTHAIQRYAASMLGLGPAVGTGMAMILD